MYSISYLYILSALFILFFLIREYVAFKRYLTLKYFFTPSLTLILVTMMILSILMFGADRYRLMILFSLLTALIADTLMMIEEITFIKNGMIFFMMAHIFYVGAFSPGASFQLWNLVIILILSILSFLFIRMMNRNAGKMIVPVVIYTLILNMMGYFAITSLNKGLTASGIMLAAGAVLFMISDFILSVNAFVVKIKYSTVYTWLLYAPAQFLFVLSAFTDR